MYKITSDLLIAAFCYPLQPVRASPVVTTFNPSSVVMTMQVLCIFIVAIIAVDLSVCIHVCS